MRAYSGARPGVHTVSVEAARTTTDRQRDAATSRSCRISASAQTKVKNIIIMLGDGMGAAHRTAARIMIKGYAQGKAQEPLAMDTFPVTGMVMTASLNSIVTDSSPGMPNYVTGNKANNNQEGVFPDDTADAFDNPRIEYLSRVPAPHAGQGARHRHHRRRVRRHAGGQRRAHAAIAATAPASSTSTSTTAAGPA